MAQPPASICKTAKMDNLDFGTPGNCQSWTPEHRRQGTRHETELEEDNGCSNYLGWLWTCIMPTGTNDAPESRPESRLESRPKSRPDRLSFGCVGTPPSSPNTQTIVGNSASSRASEMSATYRCYDSNCREVFSQPSLLDWHWEKQHKGGGGSAARRQREQPSDSATLRPPTRTSSTLCVTVTKKPKVLNVLSCETSKRVKAFVQSEGSAGIKQWSETYSLDEFYDLDQATDLMEDFLRAFHNIPYKVRGFR